MKLKILNKEWREQKMTSWAGPGLLVFITAFIWAPSKDGLIGIYALAFFIPMLLVLPWQMLRFNLYKNWALLIAIIFASYCVLSVLWSSEPRDFGYFSGVWLLLVAWLLGVAWLHKQRPVDMEYVYNLIVTVGVLTGISTIIIFYAEHPFSHRLSSWTVSRNPVVVAQIFGVVSLLAWVQSWRVSKRSWWFFAAALGGLSVCIMTQSRGPLLALGLTLFLAFWVIRPIARIWVLQFSLLFGVAIVYLVGAGLPLEIIERGMNWSFRDLIWIEVIQRIPEHFWGGIGLTKDTNLIIPDVDVFQHTHNAHLDTFYRTGFIGFGLLLGHFLILLRTWRDNIQLAPLFLWLIFGVLCVSSNTRILFWQLDAKWFLYWIPAGLIGALAMRRRVKESDV